MEVNVYFTIWFLRVKLPEGIIKHNSSSKRDRLTVCKNNLKYIYRQLLFELIGTLDKKQNKIKFTIMVTINEFSTMQFSSFHYHDPQDNVITIDEIPQKCCEQPFNSRLAYFNHFTNEHDKFFNPHPIFRSGFQCRHLGCRFYTRSIDKILDHKAKFQHSAFLSDFFGDTILFCTDLLCTVSIKQWQVTSQSNIKGNTTDLRARNRVDFDSFRHARFTDFTRPIPIFHSSSNLFQVRYSYKYRPFTIIYSRDDPFTPKLLQKFKKAEEHGRVSSQGFSIPVRFSVAESTQHVVVDALTGMAETLGFTVATIGSIASLALSTNWKQATAAVMTLAGILGPTFISYWMKQSNSVKSQSSYSYVPAAVALFILVVFGSNKVLDSAGCTMFQKVLGAGFTFSSIAVGHRMFKDIWSEIFPLVYEWLFECHPDFQAISDNVKGFDELKQMVEVFDKERRYEHIATNAMICDQVSQMEIKMDKVFQECERLRLRVQALPVMASINLKIREWSKQVAQSGHLNNGPRPEPLVIQLFGASGVGKSTMTNCLMIEIAKGNIEVPDGTTILQQIYVRQPENTYWSGYCGQPIISYDDFGQRADSANNPNPECMELIRAAGHLPFQVNMAEVENKARTYLKAKLIVLTSNEKRYNFQSVTHLPAVYRRIDILAEVKQAKPPRFQNDREAWTIELYDKDANATGKHMNFNQFVTYCRSKYQLQMERSATIIGSLLTSWDEPIIDEPWIDTTRPPPDNKFKGADIVAAIAAPGRAIERAFSSKKPHSQMFGYFQRAVEEAVSIPPVERTIYEGLLAKWDESSNFGKFALAAAGMLGVVGVIAALGFVVAKLGDWVYTLLGFSESTILTPVAYDAMYQDTFVGCLTAVDYANIHSLWIEMKTVKTTGKDKDGNDFESTETEYRETSYDDYNAAALEEYLVQSSGAVISQSGKQAEGNTPKNSSTVRGTSQDSNARDIRKKIGVAQYYVASNSSNDIAGIGTFIRGRTMLINKHVLEGIFRLGDTIKIFNSKELAKSFTKDSLDIVYHPDKDIDIALVGFPKTQREYTDLVKHFITADDLKFKQSDCALSILTQTYFGQATLQEDLLVDEGTEHERRVAKYFQYKFPTQSGDCGGLLSLINVNISRKICGIHTAGSSSTSCMMGFSTVLSQELILPLLSRIDINNRLEVLEVETTGQSECGLAYLSGDVQHLGRVKPVHENNKTTIKKSKIHGVFPVTKRPCVLRDQPTMSPFWKGLQNYTKPLPALTHKQYKNACRVVKMVMMIGACFLSCRVLTKEEAVYGSVEFPTLEGIARNKSAGYPWMLDAQAKGKMKWIPERDQGELHPDLIQAIEYRIECAKRGIIVPAIFVDTLKDERKSLKRTDYSKPEDIKTRVFSACPMDLAICLRMYYGAYHDHLQKNLINNTTTTGVNPYSSSWHVLAETLKVFGNSVADGDYERFDSTQNVAFLSAHFEAAKEWYRIGGATDEDQLVREVLSRNVLFSLHVARGFLYQWNGRLPSGVVGTTFINSSVNLAAFATAWDLAVPDHAGAKNFVENVKIVTHGDDNLYTVRQEHRDKFSPVEVGEAMQHFGMVYTSATKDDALGGFKPIECCTFLKRGFKQMEGFYRAPLDIESCKDMVNWIRKSPDDIEATKANAITSSLELGYTDPSGETTRQIEEALLKAGIPCPLWTTEEVILSHSKFF